MLSPDTHSIIDHLCSLLRNYNPGFEDTGHQLLFESLIPAEHGEFKVSEFLLIPEVLPFMDDDGGVDSAASEQRNFAHDESVTNLSHRAQRIASIRRPCDSEALLLCGGDAVAQTSISISCVTPKIWRVEYFVADSAVQEHVPSSDVEGVTQSKAFKSFAVAESSLPNNNSKLILAERELNSGKHAIFLSADQENSDDPCIEVAVDKDESHISFFSAHKQTQVRHLFHCISSLVPLFSQVHVLLYKGSNSIRREPWNFMGKRWACFTQLCISFWWERWWYVPSTYADPLPLKTTLSWCQVYNSTIEALIYGLGERSLLRFVSPLEKPGRVKCVDFKYFVYFIERMAISG